MRASFVFALACIGASLAMPVELSAFSFTDCGAASDPIHVQRLNISPDPVVIPGTVSVYANASIASVLTAPISADIQLYKGSLKIPCIDKIGSCHYDDICELLAKIPLVDGHCPDPMPAWNVPCRCPLPAGAFFVPPLSVNVPKLPPSVPGWLSNGDYKINAKLNDANGEVACFELTISLKASAEALPVIDHPVF